MQWLQNVVRQFQGIRRFEKLNSEERKIVFYSEFSGQWAYFKKFIEELTQVHHRKVCYLTSSLDDPIFYAKNKLVIPIYIGRGSARTILFAKLKTKVMVMTLLDFDSYYIKRSKHPVHYVFLPHNMVSTHMVFRRGAHNNFDTIFCVGPHHVTELREAEVLYDLPSRNLVENGYVRLDEIYQGAQQHILLEDESASNILIAPSWGEHGLFETDAIPLIESLLKAGHTVFLRPHRETLKQANVQLRQVREHFSENPNLIWTENSSSNELYFKSHVLVTDWSGVGMSFAFGTERPVLFLDLPKKVNNPDYVKFKNQPVEIKLREILGKLITPADFSKTDQAIFDLWQVRATIRDQINETRKDYTFNFGCSARLGAEWLLELADKNDRTINS